nr:uncharacterized protein LOC119170088 [Rhipicephalus microplus]
MDSLHRRPYASSESWPESPPEPAPAVPPRNAYAEPPSYSETTGPMVPPAASRVNPQLIIEAPRAASTSLAAALTQRLRPRSGWQWACLALAALAGNPRRGAGLRRRCRAGSKAVRAPGRGGREPVRFRAAAAAAPA